MIYIADIGTYIIIHFNINYIMRDMVSANYIYKYLAIWYNVGECMSVPNTHTKCVIGILDVCIVVNIILLYELYIHIYIIILTDIHRKVMVIACEESISA